MAEEEGVCFLPMGLELFLGGIALLWLFCGLYVVCEKYFVKSLEIIGNRMGLSESVQGATLLAVGSSLPELFTATIGLFVFPESNPGPATNVGSAVFNTAVIIGCSCIARPLSLDTKAVCRDAVFYITSLVALFFVYSVSSPGVIQLWESFLMLALYVLYVGFLSRSSGKDEDGGKTTPSHREIEFTAIQNDYDNEDLFDSGNVACSDDEYAMEGRVVELGGDEVDVFVIEREARNSVGSAGDRKQFDFSRGVVELETTAGGIDSPGEDFASCSSDTPRCRHATVRGLAVAFEVSIKPFEAAYSWTIPNVVVLQDDDTSWRNRRSTVILAAISSIVWIGVLTWIIVAIAEKAANCIGVDATLTGVSVLAIGSSLPDLFSSLIVAREGKGGMAVANALGSNIFDILICLGVPFSVKALSLPSVLAVALGPKSTRSEFLVLALLALLQILVFIAFIFLSRDARRQTTGLQGSHGIIMIVSYVLFLVLFSVGDFEFFE